MKTEAQIAAAIAILDNILDGVPINKALIGWFRSNRFAGSKDRMQIRDYVFNSLRFKRSLLWSFGEHGLPKDGRALLLGLAHQKNMPIDELFNGLGHGPRKISEREKLVLSVMKSFLSNAPNPVKYDFPDFLEDELQRSLKEAFHEIINSLNARAGIFLRVNNLKSNVDECKRILADENIWTEKCFGSQFGLKVVENKKRIEESQAFKKGKIEIQDISSQIAIEFISPDPGISVLDFCAGGGGKSLAVASFLKGVGFFFAYDHKSERMNSIEKRMARADVTIKIIKKLELLPSIAKVDLVLVDAPCSGTGAWHRNPGSKWWLTQKKFQKLINNQREILNSASKFVHAGGKLAYMTCSILKRENKDQISWFLNQSNLFSLEKEKEISPITGGDGFYIAILKKKI